MDAPRRENRLRATSAAVRGRLLRGALAALAAAGAAAALEPASAVAAPAVFRGAADIRLGETIHAAFPGTPAGPHRYTFFATAGTSVSAILRTDDGALKTKLALVRPGGARVNVGRHLRAAPGGPRIEGYRTEVGGFFVLEVTDASGSGGYTLSTRGRPAATIDGFFPGAPAGDAGYSFEGQEGSRVTVRITPRGRGPLIVLTSLVSPQGDTLPVLSQTRGRGAELRDYLLPSSGRFRLNWTNRGTAGDLRLVFRTTPAAATAGRELGVSDGLDTSVIEKGDPVLAAREGYVGSAACGRCHGDVVREWSDTAHNAAVRSWNRAGLSGLLMANDSNGNGADDFKDGLDLATTPAFAAFGVSAPQLMYTPGAEVPYQVRIGVVTYTVDRTMGGNGLWTQVYLTKTGGTYHPLPFAYDETTRTYIAYETQDWYLSGHDPRFSAPEQAPNERSFEARCSGCHNTGETLAAQSGTGRLVTGYVEMNIGCEQCHGAGAGHVAQGDTRKIENPRDLLDGTAAGVAAANAICTRCHTKGESVDALPGGTATAGFGFLRGRGVSQAGDRIEEFLRPAQADDDLWGRKTNPIPQIPGDTSVAARSHPLQGLDIALGGHGPVSGTAAACFDCHDPHSRAAPHQIARHVDRGVRVTTSQGDNSLCLSCHAGSEPFGDVSKAEVAQIATGPAPASVARAVIDHMKDVGMPVRDGFYDPQGTGAGLCTSCHMPLTSIIGAPGADAAGFTKGRIASHRFEVVWPMASAKYGVTNSCNRCHPTSPGDGVADILSQWAAGAATGDPVHSSTAFNPQNGTAHNGFANPTRNGGVRCAQCHTTEGFLEIQVKGNTPSQAEVDKFVKESVGRDIGITCQACHGRRGDGVFYGTDRNPLRFPRDELCARCHNAGTVVFADFRDHGEVVRHPQAEMIAGNAGDAAPGTPASATTAHSFLKDSCVTCHFDANLSAATHDFEPKTQTCTSCHKGLTTFNRPSSGDWDGDGLTKGVQDEVTGLLGRVKTALLGDLRVTFAGGYFDFGGASDHKMTGASEAQKRAAFNWYSVDDDKSRGVHNAARAIQLLQGSYREITGSDIPGAKIR